VRLYLSQAEVRANLGPVCAEAIPAQRVRIELERKPVKGGPALPWDMVADPAPYFAADCPLLASRAGSVVPRRIGRVVRDEAEGELAALIRHCRIAYGGAINQMWWALGGDETASQVLMGMLRRPGARGSVAGVSESGGAVPERDYQGDQS